MTQTMVRCIISLALPLFAITIVRADEPAMTPPEQVRAAVGKALPLLLKGAEGHVAQRACFACHNQTIPILAMMTARDRGFSVRDEDLKKQLQHIAAFLDRNRENYLRGKGQGGRADTAGYALYALELGGWKPDQTTEAVVEYLLLYDEDRDHWRTSGRRPPSEDSDFTPTYLALRAFQKWGVPKQKERIAKRSHTVRGWLLKATARDTEDRVFRLWALHAAGAEKNEIHSSLRDLVRSQRPDGGWSQTETMDSDAYATGTALVALHQAGGMPITDPVYRRGIAFLVKTQRTDGSWLVRSRSKPFQEYYESGFPHGKDQFISMAASAWATTALAFTLPLPVRQEGMKRPRHPVQIPAVSAIPAALADAVRQRCPAAHPIPLAGHYIMTLANFARLPCRHPRSVAGFIVM